jgi:hypothetical protein
MNPFVKLTSHSSLRSSFPTGTVTVLTLTFEVTNASQMKQLNIFFPLLNMLCREARARIATQASCGIKYLGCNNDHLALSVSNEDLMM